MKTDMDFSPSDIEPWIELLSKPTMGLVAVVVLILYREAVIHLLKMIIDVIGSWLRRR